MRTCDVERESRATDRREARWVQVNCALFPQLADGRPYVPAGELRAAVQRWCEEGRLRRWFFTRKPPGLRLRFYGAEPEQCLEPVLVPWLEVAERGNLIRAFRFARYEPERFRFGGQVGMAIAHEYFEGDSALALGYEMLDRSARSVLPRRLLSVAVLNDLFSQCVDDGAEMWDIWCRLRTKLAIPAPAPGDTTAAEADRAAATVARAPAFLSDLSPATRALLDDADECNARVAGRLHAAQVTGRLDVGVRNWLSAACVFHWNRLDVAPADIARVVAWMDSVWSPHPGCM